MAEEMGQKLTEKSRKERREQLEKQEREDTALMLKLGTHDEMQPVWKELLKYSKRCERISPPYRDRYECENFMILDLVFFIQLAVNESQQSHSLRSADVDKYLSIAEAANELLRVLYNSSLDTTVYRWYSPELKNAIIKNDIIPEKLSGYASFIHDDSVHDKN